MFERIKGWFRKMFNRDDAKRILKLDLKLTENSPVDKWRKLYDGDGLLLKTANVICYEVATTALNEMEVEITGDDLIINAFNEFKSDLQNNLKTALALGGFMIKPAFAVDTVSLDYYQADTFIPIKINKKGIINECVFIEAKIINDKYYTRLEHHIYTDKINYLINNYAYRSDNANMLGSRVDLSAVTEWANIEPVVNIAGLEKPLYVYFKVPSEEPLGESIFANTVDNIIEADKQYRRLLWEFEGGELAINASDELFNENKALPKLNKRLFRQFDVASERLTMETFSPELRDISYINGLNQIFRMIEMECGLSFGILSDSKTKELTATEVLSSKQRYYSTVSAIQENLERSIRELLNVVKDLYALYGVRISNETEISITFRDSILSDEQTERNNDRLEMQNGVMSKLEYRMKWYGEDEATAKKALQRINSETSLLVE